MAVICNGLIELFVVVLVLGHLCDHPAVKLQALTELLMDLLVLLEVHLIKLRALAELLIDLLVLLEVRLVKLRALAKLLIDLLVLFEVLLDSAESLAFLPRARLFFDWL